MKTLYFLSLCAIVATTLPNTIELTVSQAKQTQMPITIIVLDKENKTLNAIAETIKRDLQFTEQFNPSIKKYAADCSKKELGKEIKNLAHAGTPLALCLNEQSTDKIEWKLYDTIQCTMLAGKRYHKKGSVVRGWAHAIADSTWKTLTGHDGFFSSRLAYCKDSKDTQGRTIRKLYVADFDGSNEELLVDAQNIIVAPRWDTNQPRLTYSEYTDTNVRLMATSLKKEQKPKNISHFDEGIEMLYSSSPNGKDYISCASRGNGSTQIYLCKNNTPKRCTKNSGNNVSPVFLDENRICFCSDFQTGSPQLYIGNLETGHLQRITKGGYCTSPNYCPKTNTIAYHKMIQGTMQIMLYDCTTKNHTPVTSNKGNKHEASFSPDGTYLLYSHEQDYDKSCLTMHNLLTHKTKSLGDGCSPHWSPCYKKFPVVA
jgi:TolB protein